MNQVSAVDRGGLSGPAVHKGTYHGDIQLDRYGRKLPKSAHGSIPLEPMTNLSSQLVHAAGKLFDRIAGPELLVRRITITANRVTEDAGVYQLSLFTNTRKLEAEKRLQSVLAGIKRKYGKNAVLKGVNFLDGATMRERNGQIGGHRA